VLYNDEYSTVINCFLDSIEFGPSHARFNLHYEMAFPDLTIKARRYLKIVHLHDIPHPLPLPFIGYHFNFEGAVEQVVGDGVQFFEQGYGRFLDRLVPVPVFGDIFQ
jgi:hypothetical protein